MKSTGIVRQLDPLGRLVLPMELRKKLDLKIKDPVEIFVDGSNVILRKFERGCIFCSEITENEFLGKSVCNNCIEEIKGDK